jgi:predicted neuraminidase
VACNSSKKIEKSDFTKETVLKLEPGEDNPRNSEGDFITLKSGRILFVYSHYTGKSSSDHASAYLASRYSDDNGKTWSTKSELVVQKEGTMNVMSVSLLRLKNGEIALFYLKKNAIDDCIPMVRFSKDEAKTWSEPLACIADQKGYFVLNNNRVIQLKNGRLVFAVALHQTPETKWSGTGRLFSYYSDDNGKTWKAGGEVANPNNIVTQEPGVIELKNGDIFMFIRAGAGVQYKSVSKDKGITWSTAEPTTIKSPLSPASIGRIPKTGDLFLVWNNNDGSDPKTKGKRTPLSIAVSKDDGKTWEKIKNIEVDPEGWYCYMAIHFTKNDVLLGYCSNAPPRKGHLTQTNITRLSLDWIYN